MKNGCGQERAAPETPIANWDALYQGMLYGWLHLKIREGKMLEEQHKKGPPKKQLHFVGIQEHWVQIYREVRINAENIGQRMLLSSPLS